MMQTSNHICKALDFCLCCNNSVRTILDLNEQPPANSYLKSPDDLEIIFPLKLNYCNQCTHLQLSHVVDPDILFKNYLYVSGTTQTLKQYFSEFVKIVEDHCKIKNTLRVLDIACNDGSQLDAFKASGHQTYGIDPAMNLYEISSKSHSVVCDYLSVDSISRFNTKFDVIIAQNVFAHNAYPRQFLDICKNYLNDNGMIFIQTSQADMIKYGQFDTVYHEHISFFNTKSMRYLVNSVDLNISKIVKTPIHGNSYVFMITKYKNDIIEYVEDEITDDIINMFVNNVKQSMLDLKNKIEFSKTYYPDYLIVGYGAAAKGNTVLNYGKIKLDYIVDDNPLKQGLYTPGMKIPIISLENINSLNKNIIWIPLAWNFFAEIKSKILKHRSCNTDIFIQMNFAQ